MISAVVLAKNEEENLPRCLKSLRFCNKILVIDDNSTDHTVALARSAGAQVITRPLSGDYSAQRNFALTQITEGWVLFVDADEEISPELSSQIQDAITRTDINSYFLVRSDILWGRKMKHGDTGNIALTRLARAGYGRWSGKVHEVWTVPGRSDKLTAPLWHFPHPTLVDFLRSINFYSSLRAEELFLQKQPSNVFSITVLPVGKFLHLYIFRLGFLDGTPGFISAGVLAFYTFLTRAKLYLLLRDSRSLHA